jgi:hypothetical protein
MTAGTLWIEMTIAGFVYVASLFFLLVGVSSVGDLESLAHQLEPYLTYVAVAVVGLSYIFGFVAHRIIQIASQRLEHMGEWCVSKCILKGFDYVALAGVAGEKDLRKRMKDEMALWEMDPQRIYREIDFQFAQVALLRSLLVSVPLLALSIHYLRFATGHPLAVVIGVLFLYGCILLAFRRQSVQYDAIRQDAVDVGKRHTSRLVLSPSGPAGTLVTIKGIDFGKTQENSTVTINGVVLTPIDWDSAHIVVPLPKVQMPAGDSAVIVITVKAVLSDTDVGTDHKLTLQLT